MADEKDNGLQPETDSEKSAAEIAAADDAQKLAAEPEKPSEMEDDAADIEAILMAEIGDRAEPGSEQPDEESTGNEQGITARIAALKEFGATLDKLPADADESVKTLMLRKANKEFINKWLPELENLQNVFAVGTPEKVKEALELTDGLYGYDTLKGVQTAEKFARNLATKDPDHAYQTMLDLAMQKRADGTDFATLFAKNILELDPSKMDVFKKISRGETVEGYEMSNPEQLKNIPGELHAAFKTLTPKLRDIVLDGTQQYASEAERVEAMKVLNNANREILDNARKQQDALAERTTLETAIDTNYNALATDFNKSMPEKLSQTLDRLVFSTDPAINATMRYGLSNALRDVIDADLQPNAKKYFESLGVEAAEIDASFQRASALFSQIQAQMDIEASASARKQTNAAAQARGARLEAEKRLLAVGIGLAAKAAQKTGAKAAGAALKAAPTNQIPVIEDSSLGSQRGKLTAADVVRANREGIDVRQL